MWIVKTVLVVLAVIYILGLFIFAFRSKKPFWFILVNGLAGFFSLVILSFAASYLNISILFNIYSLAVSLILGIPGVIMIILTNMFF